MSMHNNKDHRETKKANFNALNVAVRPNQPVR